MYLLYSAGLHKATDGSLSTWTTAATVGVAFIGIASGFEMSSAVTAGAVISGAYFGDKLSPLSETTNLAPAVAGSELFEHIRYMLWTTIPSISIALTLFLTHNYEFRLQIEIEIMNLGNDIMKRN